MKYPPSRAPLPFRGLIAAALAAFVLGACADLGEQSPTGLQQEAERPGSVGDLMPQDFGPAIAAADRYTAALMNNPNIVGTGVGLNDDGLPSVRLFLMHGQVSGLPSHLDGIPVSSRVTGPFGLRNPQTRARPAPMGYSVGHPDITAGTLGARVTNGSEVFILSNNHILANSNEASLGDNALQPGPFDGGTEPADVIGTLHDYQEIFFDQNNTIDAAIALVDPSDVSGSTGSEAYGAPSSTTAAAFVGLGVQKFGRTTGHTFGSVAEINVTVSICFEPSFPFGCNKSATFVEQISITDGSFSDGGDSGSLIVTDDSSANPVGLLFAGSSTRTIANPIDDVLDRFGVTIDPTVPGGDGGGDPDPVGPTASFTYHCTELSCSFDASGSTAGDAAISTYDWNFGDGMTGSGQTTSHTYGADGTYTVTLTVTDGEGLTDSSSQNVTVAADPGDGNGDVTADPVIDNWTVNTRSTGPWNRATAQWTVSHPDNALESVVVELMAGSSVLASQTTNVSGGSASGETELRTRSTPDSVRLTVTDTAGNSVSETRPY